MWLHGWMLLSLTDRLQPLLVHFKKVVDAGLRQCDLQNTGPHAQHWGQAAMLEWGACMYIRVLTGASLPQPQWTSSYAMEPQTVQAAVGLQEPPSKRCPIPAICWLQVCACSVCCTTSEMTQC